MTKLIAYHFLEVLLDDVFALQDTLLLPSNGHLVLHDTGRRNVDSHIVFCHHGVDLLVVGTADERVVLLGNFQLLISLLALKQEIPLSSESSFPVFSIIISFFFFWGGEIFTYTFKSWRKIFTISTTCFYYYTSQHLPAHLKSAGSHA